MVMRTVAALTLSVAALIGGASDGITLTSAAGVTTSRLSASASDPPETGVDIRTLPLGARPTLPYVRVDKRVLRDGDRRVRVWWPGMLRSVDRVHGGYLLSGANRNGTGGWLAVYGRDGHRRRVLVRDRYGSIEDFAVSWDRRRVAYIDTISSSSTRVVVRRVGTGGKVAARTFARPLWIAGFSNDRLLLGEARRMARSEVFWWTPGRRKLRTYYRGGWAGDTDLSARQVVMDSDQGRRMLSIPRDAAPPWTVNADSEDWSTAIWSPDDSRIALLSTSEENPDTYQRLDIVSHEGTPEHRFTGDLVGVAGGTGRPRGPGGAGLGWERSNRFLVEAYAPPAEGESTWSAAVVRCWANGGCQRATPIYKVALGVGTPYRFASLGRG